jgi:predicted cupin superfamily sugar epimerase
MVEPRYSANDWITHLNLQAHPEGGYYQETYRADDQLTVEGLPERYPGPRSASTGIYFLLKGDQVSHLHRIRSDEMWHFYAGTALTVHLINPAGDYHQLKLGPDFDAGQSFQGVVPAGCWFGASVDAPDGYALVGCTVAPGFDFEDFELADRRTLLNQYPAHQEIIERLTS